MRIRDYREHKARIVAEMRTLNDLAGKEERDLTDDEQAKFNELKKDLFRVENNIERAETVAAAERSMAGKPVANGDRQFETAAQKFSLTRAILSHIPGENVDGGLEREVSAELAPRSGRNPQGIYVPHEVFRERRDITVGGSGAHLVPEIHRADLYIDILQAKMRVAQLGATILPELIGNIDIPRLTTGATGYWVAEQGTVTESTPAFDSVELGPKTVAADVEVTRRTLKNSQPAADRIIRDHLSSVLAAAVDNKALNGDGTSNTPTGILNTSGVADISMSTVDWDTVLSFITTVDANNALDDMAWLNEAVKQNAGPRTPFGWVMNPYVREKLMATTAITNEQFIMPVPNELVGFLALTTSSLPGDTGTSPVTDGTLIFGKWSDLIVGYWGQVDIIVDPYSKRTTGTVGITAYQDCDIAVRHAESFAKSEDVAL